ncbi:hypothetical protein MER71_19930 [Acinetobacter baumannii]|nr:hypothetical protein [Acinetobacter baumannii]
MISVIFILSGLGKIFQYSSNAGYMESMGVSSALLPFEPYRVCRRHFYLS